MPEAIHELKTTKVPFICTWEGKKNYEIRRNDRNFKINDILILVEIDVRVVGGCDCGANQNLEKYATGRAITCKVTYISDNVAGLYQGYVVLGIMVTDRKSSYAPLTISL